MLIPSTGGLMALTDTFVKKVKHTGSASGDKHADGGGMYLLVKGAGLVQPVSRSSQGGGAK